MYLIISSDYEVDMAIDISKLPYREAVIGVIVNSDGKILIVQMIEYRNDEWRFPGGGIETDETPESALLRELEEELRTDDLTIIKKSSYRHTYEWPVSFIFERLAKKKELYRGQSQHIYLVSYNGKEREIDFNTSELKALKWVSLKEIEEYFVFPGQWKFTKKVLKELLG